MNKKGQGISMTTIVIAALALIVLLVLIFIFTGKMELFSSGTDAASGCDTMCKSIGKTAGETVTSTTTNEGKENEKTTYTCPSETKIGVGSATCCCK